MKASRKRPRQDSEGRHTTTDIAIIGHTDKVGTYEANMKVSKNRAYASRQRRIICKDCGASELCPKAVEARNGKVWAQ